MAFTLVNPLADIWESAGIRYFLTPEIFKDITPCVAGNNSERLDKKSQLSYSSVKNIPEVEQKTGTSARVREEQKTFKPLNLEDWPEKWREQLKKTKRCRICWSYYELGADLNSIDIEKEQSADARKRRGNFLRMLFNSLQLPLGSNGLWPVTLDYDGSMNVKNIYQMYWSGLSRLECRVAIIFGSKASSLIMPDEKLKPLSCFRSNGLFVLPLWDINALAANTVLHMELVEYLRTYLRQIAGN